MSDVVTFEKQGQIGFITLNRPEARNAVNGAVAQAFETALDQLENDPEVWVGILRANTEGQERPVFCAGAGLPFGRTGRVGRSGRGLFAPGVTVIPNTEAICGTSGATRFTVDNIASFVVGGAAASFT